MRTKVEITPETRGWQRDKRGRRGSAVRKALCIVFVALASLILAGCERWALDRQMEALCKKDGGVKVYETVTLPASEFSNVGQPLARYSKLATTEEESLGPEYRYTSRREVLAGATANPERGEGRLVRVYWAINRRSDGKLLGEQVEYRRIGGDMFTFGFHPSSAACPHVDHDISQAVFIKGE